MHWLKDNVYIAAWLSPLIALIGMIVRIPKSAAPRRRDLIVPVDAVIELGSRTITEKKINNQDNEKKPANTPAH